MLKESGPQNRRASSDNEVDRGDAFVGRRRLVTLRSSASRNTGIRRDYPCVDEKCLCSYRLQGMA